MTAEHGGEASRRYEPGFSPFGVAGQRAGELAYLLQGCLESPIKKLPYAPGETPHWTDDDRLTFRYLLDLEASMPALADEVHGLYVEQRFPAIMLFRANLPYGPGYWDWIPDRVEREGSSPYEEQLMRLYKEGYPGQGDEAAFAHMWVAWRRRLGEFSDPALLNNAGEALGELGGELLPNSPVG